MPCYQKAKNDLNQRKNLGMGWVRQGGWHTAPRTARSTINTAASMGPFVGVFCTVPEAPSEADRSPTGAVVTCSLAHSLLVLLPPWLTSPAPHDVSWEDPPELTTCTQFFVSRTAFDDAKVHISRGWFCPRGTSGKIWTRFWSSQLGGGVLLAWDG